MHFIRKEKEKDDLSTSDIAAERARGPQLVDQEERPEERQQEQRPQTIREHEEDRAALLPDNDVRDMRSRWDKIQTGFVEEPRQAVEQADELVASAIKRIAEQFANERSQLEQQWDRGDNVSTEDLRQALRRYRAFFDRLLSV